MHEINQLNQIEMFCSLMKDMINITGI